MNFYKENQSYYNRNASVYENSSWYYFNKYKNNEVYKEINKCLSLIDKDTIRILEIGPGTGYLMSKLNEDSYKKINYLGVEHSEEMSRILIKQFEDKFEKFVIINQSIGKDFIENRLRDYKFDLIIGSSILHHLPDYDLVIHGLFQLLDESGIMYFVREPIAENDCQKGDMVNNIFSKIYGQISDWYLKPIIRSVLWPQKVKQESQEKIAIHMFNAGVSFLPFRDLLQKNELIFYRKYNRRASSFFSYMENKWLKLTRKDIFRNTLFSISIRKKP